MGGEGMCLEEACDVGGGRTRLDRGRAGRQRVRWVRAAGLVGRRTSIPLRRGWGGVAGCGSGWGRGWGRGGGTRGSVVDPVTGGAEAGKPLVISDPMTVTGLADSSMGLALREPVTAIAASSTPPS